MRRAAAELRAAAAGRAQLARVDDARRGERGHAAARELPRRGEAARDDALAPRRRAAAAERPVVVVVVAAAAARDERVRARRAAAERVRERGGRRAEVQHARRVGRLDLERGRGEGPELHPRDARARARCRGQEAAYVGYTTPRGSPHFSNAA